MAYVPNSGSVVAFQGAYSNLRAQVSIAGIPQVEVVGSVATSVTPVANQSVSGTVGASVLGHAPVVIVGGSILTSSTANQSVSGTVGASVVGHAPVVIVGGSILTSSTANQSVSGTVGASVIGTVPVVQSGTVITSLVSTIPSSVIVGASIFGLPPVNVTNTNLNVGGSVVSFPGAGWPGSVAAWLQSSNASVITVGTAAANQSVSGSVDAAQTGAWRVSVISSTPSSMLVGASIVGLPPVNVTNTNLNVGGSVVAFQGTASSLKVEASIIGTVPVTGSFAVESASVVQQGTWRVSVLQVTTPWVTTGSVQGTVSVLGTVHVTQSTSPWVITGSVQGDL